MKIFTVGFDRLTRHQVLDLTLFFLSGVLWSPPCCRRGKSQSAVQHPADARTLPAIRRGELQAAAETHCSTRSKPSPRCFPQLCQENLQEEQVRRTRLRLSQHK